MDNAAVVGTCFGSLDPFVFGPTWIRHEVLVLDDAFGRHVVLNRHFDDLVGLTNLPAVGELRRLRQICRVALG